MSEALHNLTVAELSRRLAVGQVTSEVVTRAFIERTQAVEAKVGAFLHRDENDALAQARASDARRAAGKTLGPLDGVPLGIKDVIAVKDQPLTCASQILKKFVSPYDATVTERLRAAGVVLWGRLNMDEFAMGSSTENSSYQTTANPWDLQRIPGGSSGGSAACVAAGEAPAALGSDTGGSIRQPASLCGIVGLKPTYGLVSRFGLVAFASSLDQIGPMTRTVEDAALLMQVLAGHDQRDSTSLKQTIPDYAAAVKAPAKPWTLGVPRDFFGNGLDPEVRASIDAAIKFYESKGCKIVDIKLPHADLGLPVYYIIATAEASSNLARYDGIRYTHRSAKAEDAVDIYFKSRAEGFGPEVKRRIILGTYVLSSGYYDAYYLRAQKVRTLIRRDFENAFQQVNAILTPTAPTPAFKRGEKSDDPLSMYLSDIYTISVNLAGLPGLSLPCGFTKNNLPIGLQLIGRPFAEADLLAMGRLFEAGHDYHTKRAVL
jgi:aspartyl-tRNA(Asn)/glutamyl-tRNA(Gln) amidotransferase subunit A